MSCCCPSEVMSLQFIHKKIWFWGSLGNPQTFSMKGFCLLGGMEGWITKLDNMMTGTDLSQPILTNLRANQFLTPMDGQC